MDHHSLMNPFFRIVAAVLGSYVLCWGIVALGIAGMVTLGMPFVDAMHLSNLLAFLFYIAAFLWAFAVRSLLTVWLVLVGGGALMTSLASFLQSRLSA